MQNKQCNLAYIEREAGDENNAKHCKTNKCRKQSKRNKTTYLVCRVLRALQVSEGPQPTE